MSKFCQACGSPLNENAKFCINCGGAIDPEPVSPVQTVAPAPSVCPNCGVNIEPGVKFCTGCGYSVSNTQVQANTPVIPPQQPDFAQPQAAPAPKKSSAGWIIAIVLMALILIGGVIGGIYLFTRDKDDDDDDKPSKNSKESSYVESKKDSKKDDSSKKDSKKDDSSSKKDNKSSSKEDKKQTTTNDLDPYGVFTASKYNRGYQVPIGKMMYGVEANDYSIFMSAYPKFVIDYYDDVHSTQKEKDDFIENLYSLYLLASGDNFKINCETISEVKLSETDIEDLEAYCKATYDTDVEIEEAYNVAYKIVLTVNGSEPYNTSSAINCVKIDGKWYVLE